MAWSAPHTFTTSEVVTASTMNTYVSNNLTFLGATAAALIATGQTTTSLSYTDLATVGPAVTLTTMTTVVVLLTSNLSSSAAGGTGWMSVAVSGASTIGAQDANSVEYTTPAASPGYAQQFGAAILLTGLTAGSNTFTAKYHTTGSNTLTAANRNITVIPLTT